MLGLVLEGGGMRGIYTVGVLDALMDQGVKADYVIGVSAGACNGVSYVSGQRGRGLRVNADYITDKRYISFNPIHFLKTKSVFGMDFIFDEIPNRLDPFDYDAYAAYPGRFITGVTDVETGRTVYFEKADGADACTILRASSAIPIFSPPVAYRGGLYLDGGTTDPIPVKKAIADGCDRVIVVLTQHRGFVKQPQGLRPLYRWVFRDRPAMIDALDRRHIVYNETLEYIKTLEASGVALVIAPKQPLQIDRFEKNREKLLAVYRAGLADANEAAEQIKAQTKSAG